MLSLFQDVLKLSRITEVSGEFYLLAARIHNLKTGHTNNSLDCSAAIILPMQIPPGTSVGEVTKDTMVFMFYWISIIHISNITP